ncbi:MAG: hypothetical protein ACWA6X_09950 [Bauldia sp.]
MWRGSHRRRALAGGHQAEGEPGQAFACPYWRAHVLHPFAAAIVASVLTFATPALPQPASLDGAGVPSDTAALPTAAEIEAHLRKIADHPAALRVMQERVYGPLSNALADIISRAFLPIIVDPAYSAYVAERLPILVEQHAGVPAMLAQYAAYPDAWILGMQRLAPDRQSDLYRVSTELWQWLAANDREACRKLALMSAIAVPTAATSIEMFKATVLFYEANLSAAEHIFAVATEALRAEISDQPPRRGLTAGSTERAAMEAYRAHIFVRAAALRASPERLATDGDRRCEAHRVDHEALWDLSPSEREIVINAFLVAVTDSAAFDELWPSD